MSNPSIHDRVRSQLVLRRLRHTDLGDALGLSQSAISRRLTGEMEFSAGELQKVAEFLEVPVSTLYGEVPA